MKFTNIKKVMVEDFTSVILKSICVGALWFLIEYSFVYVLQIFLVVIKATDHASTFVPSWLTISAPMAVILLFGFGLIRGSIQMLRFYLTNSLSQKFISKHRASLSEFAIFYGENEKTSDVFMIFNEVIANTSQTITRFSELIVSTIVSTFLFLAAFHLAPRELTVSFALLVATVLPLKLLNKRILIHGQNLLQNFQNASGTLMNCLRNRLLINIYNVAKNQVDDIKQFLASYRKAYDSYYFILSFKQTYPQMMGICIISLVTYLSITHFQTPGVRLLAFYFLFIRLAQSCSDITVLLSDLKLHESSTELMVRWIEKFDSPRKQQSNASEASTKNFSIISKIKSSNLAVGYHGKVIAQIEDLSLTKGSILTVKGPSGSGKSTLIATLAGLIPPVSGDISYNDNSIARGLDPAILEKVGYVGPEPFIFPATVKENLLFANKHFPTERELWAALKNVGLLDEIENFALQLNEPLNENTQLSTGQKQRLSLARALLRNPEILILDEATANLDQNTESKIIQQIVNISPTIIVVAVTHKNSFDSISTCEITLKNENDEQRT